ncbi:MAG: RES family NAD+ phosphorylase [Actinomycetota bacterium]|nr:RES family NAD+ phosphorylase [Actinomycetota bacterium]
MTSLDRSQLATAPRTTLVATAVRHLSLAYDPRSGEEARINGGRFDPPDSFPALYLCETRPCAVAELTRLGMRHVVGVEGVLPRVIYRYELQLDRVLDLTDEEVRDHLGVSVQDLTGEDWSLCQTIGTEAHAVGDQAIRTFSATGVDTWSSSPSSWAQASSAWTSSSVGKRSPTSEHGRPRRCRSHAGSVPRRARRSCTWAHRCQSRVLASA